MKLLTLFILSVCLLGSGSAFAQQQPKHCGCKDCKCSPQSHCGCYSEQGCPCNHQNGQSTCGQR